jgi:uncharacterized protein (DUF1330 family)
MPAYVIGQIHVRDPAVWREYVSQVGGTIAQYGGEVTFRAERAKVFAGESPFESTVVIKFADQTAANRWHDSPEYSRLIPLRDASADVILVCYQA